MILFPSEFQKQFNSSINNPHIKGIAYNQILNWLPQSAGLIFSIGEFRLGAGMSQVYNSELDFGPIEVTTVEQPDGTGEFFSANQKTIVTASSLITAYPVHEVFTDDDQLSIGTQLNLHFIHYKESFLRAIIVSNFKDVSWSAGLNYKFSSSIPLTQISIFFEKGVHFQNSIAISGTQLQIDIAPDSSRIYTISPSNISLEGYIPDKLSLGLLYQPTEKLLVAVNISNTFWNSYQEDIHDQIEFSSNIIYKWDNFITTSAGIYLTDRNYFVVYSSYYENSAVFQSLGAIINLPGFNIEIALADSHLFSDELRKQTLVKLGLNLLM